MTQPMTYADRRMDQQARRVVELVEQAVHATNDRQRAELFKWLISYH